MAVSAEAKHSWRLGIVGVVPIASARGLAATVLAILGAVVLFVPPALALISWAVTGVPAETGALDKDLLALSMGANAVLLLILPILVILLTRPGNWGAPAVRLRMTIDRRTPLLALLGAAVTIAALLLLGAALAVLERTGLYHAEESDLVPQIKALLTPAVLVAVPIVAAVTEEVYFRGFLQPRIGLIGSNLLFALVHAGYSTVLQIVAPFLLGLLFGLLFQRTRTLWAPIAGHFAFDFVQFLALYFLP